MSDKIKNLGTVLEKIANKILLLIAFPIFWGLTYYSIRYTEELMEGTEIPFTIRDHLGRNLLMLIIVFTIFFVLRSFFIKRCKFDFEKICPRLVAIATIYVATVCLIWVSFCHVKARADGGSLCYIAKLIMKEGSFGTMVPPGYMSYNPHQYSLLAVIQILYYFFGIDNHQPFQYMNALCMPLLFYSGYKIISLIYRKLEPIIYYIILFVSCLPLFLYVSYVYGEITSITFTMVLMWQVILYCKTNKKSCFIWGTLAIVFACIMRMNSLIVLVACGIVLIVHAVRNVKVQAVAWLLVMILAVFATDSCIRSYYEKISGKEVLDGIPYISYVLMGLEDGERGPGWYNGTNYNELLIHDYDTELTAIDNTVAVKERLKEFWNNKPYGIDFFRRKILSQWNSPAYHSLYETRTFNCKKEELPEFVHRIYYENDSEVRAFMNSYQLILYISAAIMVTVALFSKKKDIALENRILLISIIGGFLFSIIWEAMSRYVLPYVVYMIPLAAVGMWQLQQALSNGIARLRQQ